MTKTQDNQEQWVKMTQDYDSLDNLNNINKVP